METPYLAELMRRLRLGDAGASIRIGANGAASIVWSERGVDHPLLLTSEHDLAASIAATGVGARDAVWPDCSRDEAGFNLLMTHLDEVLLTHETSAPLRVTRAGPEWPD